MIEEEPAWPNEIALTIGFAGLIIFSQQILERGVAEHGLGKSRFSLVML